MTPLDISSVDLEKEENRIKQAILILSLFDKWDLSTEDQLNLLGLS